jgi:hypothetical protein
MNTFTNGQKLWRKHLQNSGESVKPAAKSTRQPREGNAIAKSIVGLGIIAVAHMIAESTFLTDCMSKSWRSKVDDARYAGRRPAVIGSQLTIATKQVKYAGFSVTNAIQGLAVSAMIVSYLERLSLI